MRTFIEENKLSFEPGSRNTTVVALIGYAQSKGLTSQDLIDVLKPEIANDKFISEEVDRLWDYCKSRNYKNYWSSKEASELYVL